MADVYTSPKEKKKCEIGGCDRPSAKNGLCHTCLTTRKRDIAMGREPRTALTDRQKYLRQFPPVRSSSSKNRVLIEEIESSYGKGEPIRRDDGVYVFGEPVELTSCLFRIKVEPNKVTVSRGLNVHTIELK